MKNISQLLLFDRECRHLLDALQEQLQSKKPLPLIVNGLLGSAIDALCVEALRHVRACDGQRPGLYMVGDEKDGLPLTALLQQAGLRAAWYPFRDFVYHPISASHDTERERLLVLHGLLRGEFDAVVTTPAAALQLTLPRETLEQLSLTLRVGMTLSPDHLSRRLAELGYARVDLVDGAGQFARRGGIIDFCTREELPVRLEFFGDEVDRVCAFDPVSQRVTERLEECTLLPAGEVLFDPDCARKIRAAAALALKQAPSEQAEKELRAELAALDGGTDLHGRDKYIALIYPTRPCLFDHLPELPLPVFLLDSNEIKERTDAALALHTQTVASLVEGGLVAGRYACYTRDAGDWEHYLSRHVPLYVNTFAGVHGGVRSAGLFGFRCRHTPVYADNFKLFAEDLHNYLKTDYVMVAVCEHTGAANALLTALQELEVPAAALSEDAPLTPDALRAGVVYVGVGSARGGYELWGPRVVLIAMNPGDSGVGLRRRTPIRQKKYHGGEKILSYAELSVGDYVVHQHYGIGRFEGMQRLTVNGVSRDYITIRYAGADQLFLPADRLEMIAKYIGAKAEDGTVKLSKMGGAEWQRAKSRAQGAARELAKDLVRLYARRQQTPGFCFLPDGEMEAEFDAAFEFEETESQLQSIDEIKSDMCRPVPMDRLLCGDVGFGKTEVAFRAAFKAVSAGKQVAILVPTTILAMQHYQTALSRMRGFPVHIEMLSRFRTPAQRALITRRLKRGDIDIIIGTHSLLGPQIAFKDLGLLVVDEEQRFGVAQKEKIKALAANVDVLTLTATPIPRTLHMAMSGIRDMSLLDEAPGDRHPVQTYVMEHDDAVIHEAIRRELRRGGQVLYLYNRIETIDLVAGKINRAISDCRVAWAHGQMEREALEDIWQTLVRGDVDVLVCTTIIETGVDLPNANTLIIEDADRMGLAQLHQLRGRVGRSNRQAYAYCTFRRGKALTDIAAKRLAAIRDYAEFGAGFKIALRDLEIRGAGNLLGNQQHGHIEAVGYDLYVRLLEEAVLEERGIPAARSTVEATVEIAADALIPESYLPTAAQRMEMYKKISHIQTREDLTDLLDELCDRYGDPPPPTLRLLHIALLRALAARCRFHRVEQKGGEVRFHTQQINLTLWSELFATRGNLRFSTGTPPHVSLKLRKGEDAATAAVAVLTQYAALWDEEETQGESG
ncbi:MAG: transcription-repair coupling factor [Eubacteriales bacterium]